MITHPSKGRGATSEPAAARSLGRASLEQPSFQSFLDSVPDAMVVVDQTGTIMLVNAQVERLFGYAREELVGRALETLIPRRFHSAHGEHFSSYFAAPRLRVLDTKAGLFGLRRDGSEFPAEISLTPIRVAEGVVVSSVIRDGTSQKRREDALRARVHRQAIVSELRRRALAGTPPEKLMAELVRRVADELEIEFCKVLLLLPGDEELALVAGVGWRDGLVGAATVSAGRDSQAGFTLLINGPVVVEDLRTELRFRGPRLLTEHGVVSGVSVPVYGHDRPLGVLGAHSAARRSFSHEDVSFLEGVASVLAALIDHERVQNEARESNQRLRNLAARLHAVREDERTAIAREIHDDLGQALTALKMDLHWLTERVSGERDRALPDRVLSMVTLLDTTLHDVRRLSTRLRPHVLDHLGLTAAIEWQANQFRDRFGIPCELECDGETLPLCRDKATAVFRVFQEALTNVARHAEATRVRARLRAVPGGTLLEVRDDGKGISNEAIASTQALGLIGMRERVAAFGGEVLLRRAEEGGTLVALRMPSGAEDR